MNQETAAALQAYALLEATSQEMLVAARAGDWDRVITLERQCASVIDHLREHGDVTPADTGLRERKAALIRSILRDDAEIRALAQPRLATLGRMLGADRTRQRLESAYR